MDSIKEALSSVQEELKSVTQKILECAEKGEDEKSFLVSFLLSRKEELQLQLKEKELQLQLKELENRINERAGNLKALFLEGKGEDDPLVRLLKEEKKEFERRLALLWESRLVLPSSLSTLEGPAAGEPGNGGKFEKYAEESLQLLRQLVNQEGQSKAFSDCGLEEAANLLRELDLTEEIGNELYPVKVPEDTPKCEVFDYSQYASETEGTRALGQHHEKQLHKLGVRFGRDGLKVYDMHAGVAGGLALYFGSRRKYRGTSSVVKYKGTVDAGIAPYGLALGSAVRQLRMAYEHKQPSEHRDENRRSRGRAVESSTAAKPLSGFKGQAIVEILAAYAVNHFPLMLDLTDGEWHYLLQLSGSKLVVWEKLGPTEAYYKQAQLLKDVSLSELVNNRYLNEKHLGDISEELALPLKKLRPYSLQAKEKLLDQLDFLQFLPMEERVGEALEWFRFSNAPIEGIPEGVAHFYA